MLSQCIPNLSNQRYRVPEPRARAGTGNAPEIPSVGLGNTQYVFDKSRAPHRCGTVHVFENGRPCAFGAGVQGGEWPSHQPCAFGAGVQGGGGWPSQRAPKRVLQSSMNIRKKAAERSRPRTS